MKLIYAQRPRSRPERPWHEALPLDPKDPDIVRVKARARARRSPRTVTGQVARKHPG